MHIPMASHEGNFQIYGLHFVMKQAEAAGFSCHIPAMREGTKIQVSVLAKGDENIHQKKQVGCSCVDCVDCMDWGSSEQIYLITVSSRCHQNSTITVTNSLYSTICALFILHDSA